VKEGKPQMTEDQIERRVERMMDALDAQLMNGALTQREYDSNVRDLNAWAEAKMNARSVECPHLGARDVNCRALELTLAKCHAREMTAPQCRGAVFTLEGNPNGTQH
jgi:hypothetical protein